LGGSNLHRHHREHYHADCIADKRGNWCERDADGNSFALGRDWNGHVLQRREFAGDGDAEFGNSNPVHNVSGSGLGLNHGNVRRRFHLCDKHLGRGHCYRHCGRYRCHHHDPHGNAHFGCDERERHVDGYRCALDRERNADWNNHLL
jgi:hypothetical protein